MMDYKRIKAQCEAMTDRELVRALTVESEQYIEEFREIVRRELHTRNITVEDFIDTVRVRLNEREEDITSTRDALTRLSLPISLGDAWVFTNCMEETLVIQKEYRCVALHYLVGSEYRSSYFIDSVEHVEEILRAFLNLEEWEPEPDKRFEQREWSTLVESRSGVYVRSILAILAEADIPATVQSTDWHACRAIQARHCGSGILRVMVLERDLNRSRQVMNNLGKTIERLYMEARDLDENGDRMKALEIYSKLYGLVPDDVTVAFNMGVILYDLERYGEAVDAFVPSVLTGNKELREESTGYLKMIQSKSPDNVTLLHTLAGVALRNGEREEARHHLEKILSIQPTDAMACLNLGYLFYEDSKEDDVALTYFRKYLELEPEAEDRPVIEEIIKELEG
jgi:tetratricopeptide (TPR) repeat protein